MPTDPVPRSIAIVFGSALLVLLVLACGAPAPQITEAPEPFEDPRALLTAARQAAVETRAVQYRFEFGPRESPSTWVTGETWMLQRSGVADSSIRVEGRFRNRLRKDSSAPSAPSPTRPVPFLEDWQMRTASCPLWTAAT